MMPYTCSLAVLKCSIFNAIDMSNQFLAVKFGFARQLIASGKSYSGL
jgi:hypothetical protein